MRQTRIAIGLKRLFAKSKWQTRETGRVHLCRHEPLAILDADSLAALVESFVNTLEILRKAIASYRPVAKSAAECTDEAPQFGATDFVRV